MTSSFFYSYEIVKHFSTKDDQQRDRLERGKPSGARPERAEFRRRRRGNVQRDRFAQACLRVIAFFSFFFWLKKLPKTNF